MPRHRINICFNVDFLHRSIRHDKCVAGTTSCAAPRESAVRS